MAPECSKNYVPVQINMGVKKVCCFPKWMLLLVWTFCNGRSVTERLVIWTFGKRGI
jgi:hypothetical protein